MENYFNFAAAYGPNADTAYYNEMYNMYCWHFKVKDRPATWDEMLKFAQWHGFKDKEPTKRKLVEHFLINKIIF